MTVWSAVGVSQRVFSFRPYSATTDTDEITPRISTMMESTDHDETAGASSAESTSANSELILGTTMDFWENDGFLVQFSTESTVQVPALFSHTDPPTASKDSGETQWYYHIGFSEKVLTYMSS